jgi:predicted Zn-dependent peptidase
VIKKGERQILSFSLEVVNDKFAPGENLLRQGLLILRDVISDPFLENGVFKSDYVYQEKEQLAKEIKGLINDKVGYALERCIQEMCPAERFGVYKYGSIEELERVSAEGLYEYYRSLLKENPIDIFVVGEVDPKETFDLIQETFNLPRSGEPVRFLPVEVHNIPGEVRYHEEKLPVNQGKLTLGYRTNISYRDEEYVPLMFYNGILGGFPHSKLFQNVREKASLAYYSFSRLEKHKGIQLIGSGIEVKNYQQALEIILEQVELIRKGKITREEMENTRRALISMYKVVGDSPYNLVNFYMDGLIGEREEGIDYFISKIEDVREDNVVEVAHRVHLDTVYFLRSQGEERGEES